MESNKILLRVFVPEIRTVCKVRVADFYCFKKCTLPSVLSLLIEFAHQRDYEENIHGPSDEVVEFMHLFFSHVHEHTSWV